MPGCQYYYRLLYVKTLYSTCLQSKLCWKMQWVTSVMGYSLIIAATFFQRGQVWTAYNGYVGSIDWLLDGYYVRAESIANWNNGFCSLQCCSWIRLLFWWNVWISSCSYGISNDVLWIGLSNVMVSVKDPYSCTFCRICWAYADWGSLFFMYRMSSRNHDGCGKHPKYVEWLCSEIKLTVNSYILLVYYNIVLWCTEP